jgi:DNA-binding NtrC family response regulator
MSTKKAAHVLIVDDEERFRSTTAVTLQNRGFTVTAVDGGIRAIQEIRKGGVDVVVLDVKMPGKDGNRVLNEIKILKPDLPVIMLTGHGTLRSAFSALRDQVFEYLTKPCDIDILAETITKAFENKKDPLHAAMWQEALLRDHQDIG